MKDKITVYIRELPFVENVYQMFSLFFCLLSFIWAVSARTVVSENILVILKANYLKKKRTKQTRPYPL